MDSAEVRAKLVQLRAHTDCLRELLARMGVAKNGDLVTRPAPTSMKVQRFHRSAIMPKYQTAGSACFDLHTIDSGAVPAGDSITFKTGLAVEVPPGHVLMIYSRSGHGFGYGVRLSNGTGVIDSDYRGELMVRLQNDGNVEFEVRHGDRIAQAMLVPIPAVELVEVQALSQTTRGVHGFGSTGR